MSTSFFISHNRGKKSLRISKKLNAVHTVVAHRLLSSLPLAPAFDIVFFVEKGHAKCVVISE
jgi:hypothetical protein